MTEHGTRILFEQAFCERYDYPPRPPQGYQQVADELNYLAYRDGWQDAKERAESLAYAIKRICNTLDELCCLIPSQCHPSVRKQLMEIARFCEVTLSAKPAPVQGGDEGAPVQPHGAAAGSDASAGSSGATGVMRSHAPSAEAGMGRSGSTRATRETDGRQFLGEPYPPESPEAEPTG